MGALVKPAEAFLIPKVEVELFLSALSYLAQGHKLSEIEALSNMNEREQRELNHGMMKSRDGMHAYFGRIFAKCYSDAHQALSQNPPDRLPRSELAKKLLDIFPSGRVAEDFRDNILEVFDKVNAALASGMTMNGYQRATATQPGAQAARITSPTFLLK